MRSQSTDLSVLDQRDLFIDAENTSEDQRLAFLIKAKFTQLIFAILNPPDCWAPLGRFSC